MLFRRCLALLGVLCAPFAHAGPAPFDLAGPTLEMKVTRGTVTLPAAQVPSLATGDQIWLKVNLPSTQSAHYLMVVAFLSYVLSPEEQRAVLEDGGYTALPPAVAAREAKKLNATHR